MDVYGYPPYQYTQSDELTQQIFAHQALSSSAPYHREMSGPSVMPAPSGTPWNMHGMPWGMQSPPHLVHFTAQTPPLENKISPLVHCKRKNLDVEPAIPAKQLITEEKMAAHLNGLHISSEYTPHQLASEELMDVNMDSTAVPSVSNINQKVKDKFTVVLSEEVKKIQSEPLLPPSLIERLEKPHMSLVVWKPKEDILKIKEVTNSEEKILKDEEEQPKKRNGVLVIEHNGMDMEML